MSDDSKAAVPECSSPTWSNWSQNIVHDPPGDGEDYYCMPTNRAELQDVVRRVAAAGGTLRVSGQRHSQPALVA